MSELSKTSVPAKQYIRDEHGWMLRDEIFDNLLTENAREIFLAMDAIKPYWTAMVDEYEASDKKILLRSGVQFFKPDRGSGSYTTLACVQAASFDEAIMLEYQALKEELEDFEMIYVENGDNKQFYKKSSLKLID